MRRYNADLTPGSQRSTRLLRAGAILATSVLFAAGCTDAASSQGSSAGARESGAPAASRLAAPATIPECPGSPWPLQENEVIVDAWDASAPLVRDIRAPGITTDEQEYLARAKAGLELARGRAAIEGYGCVLMRMSVAYADADRQGAFDEAKELALRTQTSLAAQGSAVSPIAGVMNYKFANPDGQEYARLFPVGIDITMRPIAQSRASDLV